MKKKINLKFGFPFLTSLFNRNKKSNYSTRNETLLDFQTINFYIERHFIFNSFKFTFNIK